MQNLTKDLGTHQKIKLLESCLAKLGEVVIIVNNEPGRQGDYEMTYVNRAFSELTGYSRLEAIGKSPKILQGPKTDRHAILKISQAIASEQEIKTEILNYTKEGKEYWVDFHLVPVSIDDSPCTHFIGISFDITAYKQALQTNHEARDSLSFVLDVADFGYWDLDFKTNQTRRSLKHDQLFGHDERQPVWSYETFLSHVYADDRNRVDRAYTKAMADGSDYDVEFRCLWPDGSLHWLWSKGRFITDDDNKAVRAAGIQVDISEKKATEETIRDLAFQDPLTRLPNRHSFTQSLRTILSICKRRSQYGALLFMDLDNFKRINDSLGHNIGDQLLTVIAIRLKDCLREVDMLARFGGDEFVVILSDLGEDLMKAEQRVGLIIEKIIALFNRSFFCGEHEIYSTLSIGIAMFDGHRDSEDELLKQADLAMYQAKDSGKNMWCFFESSMRDDLVKRITIEKELNQAITNQEFHLHYQPKLDAHRQIIGFEALIRWNHPQKGNIPPLDFIGVAEESGLIKPIGQWVLNEACDALNHWSTLAQGSDISISVNISAQQFSQINFVDLVLNAADRIENSTSKLILEITESTLIENLNASIEKINQLIKYGITFSLDDFGTGYSSLYYLKNLPIEEIKIDQSFVSELLIDESDEAIVSAVISIADKLGLNVVAEGVETTEQLSFLKGLGCPIFQGYYFSKPMSLTDTLDYIKNQKNLSI